MKDLNLSDYEEVNKTAYDKRKKKSDKDYAETLRFGFRYFVKVNKPLDRTQINAILNAWFFKESTCEGKPHCAIDDCDLCSDCFFDLKQMFGLDRSFK